jgi:hypothetical protein
MICILLLSHSLPLVHLSEKLTIFNNHYNVEETKPSKNFKKLWNLTNSQRPLPIFWVIFEFLQTLREYDWERNIRYKLLSISLIMKLVGYADWLFQERFALNLEKTFMYLWNSEFESKMLKCSSWILICYFLKFKLFSIR